MKSISFSKNWNGKLDSQFYPTIRPYKLKDVKVGDIVEVLLNGKLYHQAKVLGIYEVKISNLNNLWTYIDAGVCKKQFIDIIKHIYKRDFSSDYVLSVYLLENIIYI
jgi:hypothetical protein